MLDSLKKALGERALNAEMDHHLAGDEAAGNTRHGYGRKTVMTDTGKLAIDVPRDRRASFNPQLIAKYQRRFPSLDDKIVLIYARGMSTGEIVGHQRWLGKLIQAGKWSFCLKEASWLPNRRSDDEANTPEPEP